VLVLLILLFPFGSAKLHAAIVDVDASTLIPSASMFASPKNGAVLSGSTFDVSFYLDTRGSTANGIELNIKFPQDKLAIVKPAGERSLITVWVQPPSYSNTSGNASFSGVVPGGIKTSSGLITTITFKALDGAIGTAQIRILESSKVLANDGVGTEMKASFAGATYSIEPKPPAGAKITSETHPFEQYWYNNNNPTLNWENEGASDFSFILDNKPFTVPDNEPDSIDATKSYEDLKDGIWYFHLKARKNNVWGETSHFSIRIDTDPPAGFKPKFQLINEDTQKSGLVIFLTTDSLSGLDHYEIGAIDKSLGEGSSPVFIQAESPYQMKLPEGKNLLVVVRALDKAGNVRDEYVDVKNSSAFALFIKNNLTLIIIFSFALLVLLLILHYLVGHHVIARIRRIVRYLKLENSRLDRPVTHILKPMEKISDLPELPPGDKKVI